MGIDRVNPGDWSLGGELTHEQINEIDTKLTCALDKRSSQTDTLGSVVTLTGSGRIIPSLVVGANANTTYLATGANRVIQVTTAVTSARTYTLGATGAVNGDEITVFIDPGFLYELTIKDQSANTLYVLGNTSGSDGAWASFIYIGGWRLYKHGTPLVRTRVETLSTGNWVCPRGVTSVLLLGSGAGGGGAAGMQDVTPTIDRWSCGGGGGGGASSGSVWMPVTPGTTYPVTIGVGGQGGPVPGAAGLDGGDTIFGDNTVGRVIFVGAEGGKLADAPVTASLPVAIARGGVSTKGNNAYQSSVEYATREFISYYLGPGAGGAGTTSNAPAHFDNFRHGARGAIALASSYAGGSGGTHAGDSGSFRGGGGGGGGGGGPGGIGGNGGNGGTSAGTAGGAGTGAGGGGGGGSSQTPVGISAAGLGGDGGSGSLKILYVK